MKVGKWFQVFVVAAHVMALVIAGTLAAPKPGGQQHSQPIIVITGECEGDVCG